MTPLAVVLVAVALLSIIGLVLLTKKKKVVIKPEYEPTNFAVWDTESINLLKNINKFRVSEGMVRLQANDDMMRLAKIRTSHWVKMKYTDDVNLHEHFFSHRRPFLEKGLINISENNSYGSKYVFSAWLKSDAHRQNMFDSQWKYAGISIAFNDEGEKLVCLALSK